MVRRRTDDRTTRRWLTAWTGAAVLGVANGIVRETAYKHRVGESTANQISVATLILLFAGYFGVLQRRWPIDTNRKALQIGGTWVALTVVFEFALGRASGQSWKQLVQDYDVTEGRLWPLAVVWIATGPATTRRLIARNETPRA